MAETASPEHTHHEVLQEGSPGILRHLADVRAASHTLVRRQFPRGQTDAYRHAGEAWKLLDRIVDVVWAERLPIALELIDLQALAKQLCVARRGNHIELPLEHDPSECQYTDLQRIVLKGPTSLHCINQGSLALEAIGNFLAHLVQEVVERNAEKKHLQNLFDISG